jgi:hypothetical protein
MKVEKREKLKMRGALMLTKNRSLNRTIFIGGFAAVAVLLAFLSFSGVGQSGGAASSAAVATGATFEEIPGSSIKRVILTDKSSERLGIQMGRVGQEVITRKQILGGRIIPPVTSLPKAQSAGSFSFSGLGSLAAEPPAALPAGADAWVEVVLSHGEYERLEKNAKARILPLSTREMPGSGKETTAVPSGIAPYEDAKRSMLQIYYKLSGKEHGLSLYDRVRVELPLTGPTEAQQVVPYSAVYYDGQGGAWVYANPSPLTFERRPITVKYIVGDWAVLSDGPAVGTSVVTVGAPLLYGAEVIFKK